MAIKRWNATHVLSAIKKHHIEITYDKSGWGAYGRDGFQSEEYDSLENAVRDVVLAMEAADKQEAEAQERRDLEEFDRLCKKYGHNPCLR